MDTILMSGFQSSDLLTGLDTDILDVESLSNCVQTPNTDPYGPLHFTPRSTSVSTVSDEEKRERANAIVLAQPYRILNDYSSEPRFMTSQNRLLIHHYVQNVVDLMASISTDSR